MTVERGERRHPSRHRQTRTRVFTATGADVQPGTLWVINRVRNCLDDHVGLEVEQVGAAFGNVSADDE